MKGAFYIVFLSGIAFKQRLIGPITPFWLSMAAIYMFFTIVLPPGYDTRRQTCWD